MSQGESSPEGVLIAPGQLKIFKFGVGYEPSSRKQYASLRKPVFVIYQLEFTDGTIWQVDPRRK